MSGEVVKKKKKLKGCTSWEAGVYQREQDHMSDHSGSPLAIGGGSKH